ncbi:hypothetical protein Aab01nite_07610 [Paractinoplanes abujensis]|uniref:Uncharacterized protein n=1 Tax=Paractinoplanes abujensis TaxID=882441 RepID=A0A7W7CR53_9ACTN|nr:hypothetical protein [Actinoplanes abujensis]MBB4691416.1 hypothetical protein [Actinoplanes abujensis]GID17171.1 hypothetical protein Aab01nite_07610 [Actinoplanes abujensis]
MEPVLQFDPASLSIYYRGVPHRGDGPSLLGEVVHEALLGRHAHAKQLVGAIPAEPVRIRAANLLSTVWHEQRHFVDVLLTNFGQSISRRFTSVLLNLPEIVAAGRHQGHLLVPISAYGSAAKRRAAGVGTTEFLTRAAKDIRDREMLLRRDMLGERLADGGRLSLGGHAQLEALGYFAQANFVQNEFGLDTVLQLQGDMPDADHLRNQYLWAGMMAAYLGLVAPDQGRSTPGEEVVAVQAPAVSALLYGALMIRRWGQEQTFVDGGNSGSALHRLGPIMEDLHANGELRAATSTAEAWEAVNQACARLFGRTATRELEVDLEQSARLCDLAASKFGDDSSLAAHLAAVQDARVRLAALFAADPGLVLDPGRSARLLSDVLPVPLFAEPYGRTEAVPEGWHDVWGWGVDLPNGGRMSWTWAYAPVQTIRETARIHIVADPESWQDVATQLIPAAKVLMYGRRQPATLGPELRWGEVTLENDLKVDLLVHPLYRRPVVDTGNAGFWYLTGRSSAVCDGCSATIDRGGGGYFPSSFFRYTEPAAAQWLLEHNGGGAWGQLMVERDWSGWLLCDRCGAEVGELAAGRQ